MFTYVLTYYLINENSTITQYHQITGVLVKVDGSYGMSHRSPKDSLYENSTPSVKPPGILNTSV